LARHLAIALLLVVFSVRAEDVTFRTTDFAPGPDAAFSLDGKAQLAVYRAFSRKYPDIKPEGNPTGLRFEGAAGEAPLLMSIAGGTAPNVIHVNGRQSGSYIEREFLLPLDEFVTQEITAEQARENGRSVTELHMRGLGICATTKDRAKINAAWKFIHFVGSPEAEREIVRTYVENGYGGFINPEKLEQFGYDEYLMSL